MIPLILFMLPSFFFQALFPPSRATGRCPGYLATIFCLGMLLLSGTVQAQSAPVLVGSPGLAADYYRGYFYDTLSFFTKRTPAIHNRAVENLNFGEAENDNFAVGSVATYYKAGQPDEFSARFQGKLCVTTAGSYTFYLGSDDAAYLWLDNGAQPVAFNKGDSFPFREVAGTCVLTPGLHSIRVDYGEHGGSQGLVLQYSGPDMPKQLVPNGVLYNQTALTIRPTLTHFETTAANQQVKLNWNTGTEENSIGFVVQTSTDGINFTDLMRKPGGATTTVAQNYEAVDQQPATGWNYYRVQQLRSDREPVYSPIKAVEILPVAFAVKIYPVPNNGSFYVDIQPANVGTAVLRLIDMSGRVVYHQEISLASGALQKIEPNMSTGLYLLKLTTSAGTFSRKISLGI